MALAATSRLPAADAPYPWPAEPQFLPLTAERIAQLPSREQPAWREYLQASQALAARLPKREAFVTPSTQRLEGPGIPGKHSRGLQMHASADWYASEAAKTVAERVVAAQTAAGAWTKGNDYTKAERPEQHGDVWSGGTFDNDATSWEMWFLARVAAATKDAAAAENFRASFLKGLRYILAAQYPNGGFPQIYRLPGGYHDAITYNDDAMTQALEVLRDVRDGKPELTFVPADLRAQTGPRVERGIACILASQLRDKSGQRTVWCQQHDMLTLEPCAARNFEPAASCTNESASVVKFLMSIPAPSADVVAAVKGAVAWFERVALHDIAWTRQGGTPHVVARPGAPLLWTRMYELGTDRPIFGDRDRTVHFVFDELSSERRNGYAWYGTWPASALEEYKTWAAKR